MSAGRQYFYDPKSKYHYITKATFSVQSVQFCLHFSCLFVQLGCTVLPVVDYIIRTYCTVPHCVVASFFPTNKLGTGCSLNIVFFPEKFVIFQNSASSAPVLVFYLPGVCTHTDTEGKQRKARVWNISKS